RCEEGEEERSRSERSIHGAASPDQRDPGDEGAGGAGVPEAAAELGEREEEQRPGRRPLHRQVHRDQLAGAALPRHLRPHGLLLPHQPPQGAPPPRPPRGAREAGRRRRRPPLDPRTWGLSVVDSI
ncbi:Os02g0175800, partial [Oryza sativa Japonica Group]